MRPQFESMTIAELRAYCSYIRKVGVQAHKLLSEFVELEADVEVAGLMEKARKNIKQLEVLGLSSNDNQKGD